MQRPLSFPLAALILAGALLLAPVSATSTCENSGSHTAAQLTGAVSGAAVQLTWNAISDPGFQGYKVVISKSNANPKYPDDGYLYYITDPNQNSTTVDGSATYNGGDIGGTLEPGETYYFSITTLYCDGAVPGNSISLTFPGTPLPVQTTATPLPEVTATVTTTPVPAAYRAPVVQGVVEGDHVRLSWNRIADSRLIGYKVVASRNNPAPSYPNDGYLYWITDLDQTSATIYNSTPSHGGDIGTSFLPGVLYSFSVTAVYTDGNVAGSVARLNFPSDRQGGYYGPDIYGNADPRHIWLNWGGTSDRRVLAYKVLISRNNPDPRYYGDHDAILTIGRDQNSATLDTSASYYSSDFSGRLQPGTYYLRVIAIYPDRVIHGRVIRITVPDKSITDKTTPVPTQTAGYPAAQLTGSVDGSKIRLSWTVIPDSRFQGYKVVISKNNPNPKYPDDGYLYYITDRNQHTATVDTSSSYNNGDFGGHMVPGETYYFSITTLYPDQKVAGNTISLTCPGSTTATPTPTPTVTPVVTETATPEPTTTPSETATPQPTKTTPVPTVTTATPTPGITTEPTQSVYNLIEQQNQKIDAQNQLIAEQNRKLSEQSGMLDHLLAFLRTLFRF
jgi:hypothetical protein